ncbi:Uncharacterized protein pbN1_08580 [Aromatoleum bremense]|nr:Uncharacterized protein pbN1_08580 [Aromatoleum bremense]
MKPDPKRAFEIARPASASGSDRRRFGACATLFAKVPA